MLDRILSGLSTRAVDPSGVSSPREWLVDLLGGGAETYSGKAVTVESSMSLIPVFSAVSLLAGSVGSLPLMVYRRLDEGRERASSHRTYRMLHDKPNELMAADELWEIVEAHLALWGNAYLAKGRNAAGLVDELVPLSPKYVSPSLDARGNPMYEWTDPTTGRDLRGGVDSVLHIRGLGYGHHVPGMPPMGLSPIQMARQALGNELARQEFQGRFLGRSARPSGVLKHPGELSTKARRRLEASWQAMQGGLANAGKTAILEEGMEWQSLGMPLADAQFIEQGNFSRTEIALLFRVPPSKLSADTGGATLQYATSEGDSLDYVKWSLRRWLKRIEGSLTRDPDIFVQGDRFYPEFLVDALLRGDSKTRGEFYTRALDPVKGWLDVDEVREMENLAPFSEEQLARRKEAAKAAKPPAPAEPKPAGDEPVDQQGDDQEETT